MVEGMDWIEIKTNTLAEAVDSVTELYYEYGAQGVAIEEPIDMKNFENENLYWDYVDENDQSDNKESVVIAYYSSLEENLEQKLEEIKGRISALVDFGINIGSGIIEINQVKQEDWENSWKQYFKPLHVTDKIVIKPQWEEYVAADKEIVIQIDPGMAFGTGSHETTSMCINAIEKNLKPNMELLDIGTGSGILSMAGVLLGAKKAVGVDLDPVAVRVANENALLNNLSDKIQIVHGDLVSVVQGQYEMVVANIIAEAIIILLESDVKSFVKKDGFFICSGIILEKEELVLNKLKELGFLVQTIDRQGEWVCITSRVN